MRNLAGTDVRKYKVLISAISKPLRYELEMKTPINKFITQNLPLINVTTEPNTFIITLTSNDQSKNIFSIDCEREVHVESKSQGSVNLTYKPKTQITYGGVLKIENVTTSQTI